MKVYSAGGTIRVARFVKVSTTENNTVLEADANERVIGVSQLGSREAPLPAVTTDPPNAATDGDTLNVHTMDSAREDIVVRVGSGGITAGALLKSDADGNAVLAATTGTTVQWISGVSLEAASEGEYAKIALLIFAHRPALT